MTRHKGAHANAALVFLATSVCSSAGGGLVEQ
jgi:hypothetical protein